MLEDEVFGVNEPFLIDGQAYKMTHVSATGDQLVIEPSDQTVALAVGFEDAECHRYSARQQCY